LWLPTTHGRGVASSRRTWVRYPRLRRLSAKRVAAPWSANAATRIQDTGRAGPPGAPWAGPAGLRSRSRGRWSTARGRRLPQRYRGRRSRAGQRRRGKSWRRDRPQGQPDRGQREHEGEACARDPDTAPGRPLRRGLLVSLAGVPCRERGADAGEALRVPGEIARPCTFDRAGRVAALIGWSGDRVFHCAPLPDWRGSEAKSRAAERWRARWPRQGDSPPEPVSEDLYVSHATGGEIRAVGPPRF
jgi:hypothetical protein